ncbi:Hvo_1808 family surface protein [Halomarina ordinaria]|uniref:Hvo_1808 family surface protein n=1 Tax=Halomarina ordinaria TaxID=3033939 RepID=A0ABD5UDV5_9EURY|nr:Hvo_1808 family surface protein [Halomarina sp. PSRA2]
MPPRPRPRVLAVALCALVVLSGCSVPVTDEGELGVEDGYAADADLDVTTEDGLNASERDAVVARTMARVEVIRGLEFTDDVDVRVVSRETYREERGAERAAGAFREQAWEAPFLVDEETTVAAAREEVFGAAVAGYYAGGDVVVVSDSETPMLDTRTLAHELVHALQVQHFTAPPDRRTRDGSLGVNGLVEGDANAVEAAYEARCGTEWDCLPRPDRPSIDEDPVFESGLYLSVVAPYVEGPEFVDALREEGGWTAVDDAYDAVPESSEQVVHPERYPDDAPATVAVADRSTDRWERVDRDPDWTTLGEATIYAMLRANGALDGGDRFDYDHPATDGWAGDRLVPYVNADADASDPDAEAGYVWRIEWDDASEAREFLDAYRTLLEERGADREGTVYVLPADDPYADAFRVTREGETVTVVNAPTPADLDAIHRS